MTIAQTLVLQYMAGGASAGVVVADGIEEPAKADGSTFSPGAEVLAVFPNAGLVALFNSLLCLAARSNASVELLLAAYKEKWGITVLVLPYIFICLPCP